MQVGRQQERATAERKARRDELRAQTADAKAEAFDKRERAAQRAKEKEIEQHVAEQAK